MAGVYCSCGCSCCADCYKKCCGNGDNKNEIEKINDETNEEQKDLYFKIEGGAIDSNGLGCFGEVWFEKYKKKKEEYKKNNTILLYKLTEQKDKQEEAGTLVYSKESEKLKYTNGGDFPKDLKDSNNRWAIFKVTTLKEKGKGNSYIFYCSDVSSMGNDGLFEKIECWSIEILAAKTTAVETFRSMFKETKSSLEQDTEQQNKPGFIGLEKLDVSGANNLSFMFCMALFKQKTINSLSTLRLQDNAYISKMFFVNGNILSFKTLNEWIEENSGYLGYMFGSKYNIFFQGDDDGQNKDKLPEWYKNKIKQR